jgi:hypothetical protein
VSLNTDALLALARALPWSRRRGAYPLRAGLRQGHMLDELIPTRPEHRLQPLIEGFASRLAEQPVFAKAFGGIWK